MSRWLLALLFAFGSLAFLTGCADEDSTDTETEAETPAETEAPTDGEAPAGGEGYGTE